MDRDQIVSACPQPLAHLLRQFHAALPVGGRLYIKVPAHAWLYGPVDEASGHYRRYSQRGLTQVVEAAGFRVDRCHYMNLAGVAPYFLSASSTLPSE